MTYLLDTNVLSELVQPKPSVRVTKMFQTYQSEVATATLVWHELLFGLERLPESQRRAQLQTFLWEFVRPSIPLLPYDESAARWHARERARLTVQGRTPAFVDGQIAAISATQRLVLVTRNGRDFEAFEGLQTESWH